MQTVTFETAKKLKEAGFEQPTTGTYWVKIFGVTKEVLVPYEWMDSNYDQIEGEFAYAPTATDILPERWILVFSSDYSLEETPEWVACWEEDWADWIINGGSTTMPDYFHHPNPAEAAAKAWLFVNKK